jgi:hypothetical protein
LGRSAAQNDGFYAAGLQALIEIITHEFVGTAWLLLEKLARARGNGLVNDFAAAGQRVRDEHIRRACPIM